MNIILVNNLVIYGLLYLCSNEDPKAYTRNCLEVPQVVAGRPGIKPRTVEFHELYTQACDTTLLTKNFCPLTHLKNAFCESLCNISQLHYYYYYFNTNLTLKFRLFNAFLSYISQHIFLYIA